MPDATESELERRLRQHGRFEPAPVAMAGCIIGGWKVLAFLGRGGSAEVYRAENAATGIVGALKVLYRADDKTRARFRLEAQLAAELTGAAFPKFYGAGEDSGRLYLAEELLEPMDLPHGDAAVARYVLAVARAVEELHRRGFVHRDIKPRNVMMRPSTGECVLIDLGLAKEGGESPRSRNDTLSVVDGHAVGVGTPGFSAPEQFVGGRIGAAADIHALGVLANKCFNGRPPKAWIPIIRRSTSSIPEQRYASVSEFARAVRRRHAGRWWIGGIAVGLVIYAIAAGIVSLRKDAPPQSRHPEIKRQYAKPVASHAEDVDIAAARKQPEETEKQIESPKDRAKAAKNVKVEKMRRPAKEDDSDGGLLGAVYDSMYGGDNGRYNTITNGSVVVDSIFELGETKTGRTSFGRSGLVTHIELNGRDVTICGETRLEGSRTIEIVGPGRITASITGPREASVELSRQATLINLTETSYPESAMKFILKGACYLNFKNLDEPEDGDIDGVWFDTFNGNSTPSLRYRGPDSYEEVRKADKKAALEIMRQGLPPSY